MGVVADGALSSLTLADPYLTFKIPDSWSMEDAATVPLVYTSLLYALVILGQMRAGETILVHSGATEFGQAAIRLSLYYGGVVYTTVDNPSERQFLKSTFPQLKDSDIGNSFEEWSDQLIHQATDGRGVDIVLSAMPSGKLASSLNCLARGGRVLQLIREGISNNSHIDLLLFKNEGSFHGVAVGQLLKGTPRARAEVGKLFAEALEDDAVQPLIRNVFKYDEIEQAFRFADTNRSGKVLVKVREPEEHLVALPRTQKFSATMRYFCDPEKTYVIIGGLGGFGLELADWLVLRGARKLVLNSRKGISNGYQEKRIRTWQSYGALVTVSTDAVTTKSGCKRLIERSLQLGRIEAVFNLALVLQNSLFENQTTESFYTCFAPKAIATEYLDELTREMCPDLKQFVIFSSVSCGRGSNGQTNYGMANSVMEKICEKRKQDGYPALAIEWGLIGEVGIVAETLEITEINGALLQSISSCLQAMDIFLRQEEATIVSSFVVAEKHGENTTHNVVDAVLNILGVKDVKSVSLHSTLSEFGVESMTATEIRQMLEKEFEVYLSAKEITTITLLRLKEIEEEKHEVGTS
ncbi:fatty acid synthase-like [Anoplophora glabripennis]|uniref:fatty acid synthase-like n=1 Tax=Anoplophora glabripennis TaxID=217634 RepID=UPI00087401AE|nr:fatty acid synthase-like [Anoplophora glabripennis]